MSIINITTKGYNDIDLSLFEKISESSFKELCQVLNRNSGKSLMRLKKGKSIFYRNGVIARVYTVNDYYIKSHIDLMEFIYLYPENSEDGFTIDDFDFYIKK